MTESTQNADNEDERFAAQRPRLRAVAYRMLGSLSEADDAVQEAWLRLHRADTTEVDNLDGWLTTVVARVCLDMLRARRSRREEPLDLHLPDPIISAIDSPDPEQEALLADSVGLALLVVLETLTPAERLAFVLHDMFAVPFEQIGPIVGRSVGAATQLASRARRRVRGVSTVSDVDLAVQRQAVDAFLAAARNGDFDALVAVLDPEVVLRADVGPGVAVQEVRGASTVAGQALRFRSGGANEGVELRPALVNGAAGMVGVRRGRAQSVLAVTVVGGRIATIDILADAKRLAQLDLSVLD